MAVGRGGGVVTRYFGYSDMIIGRRGRTLSLLIRIGFLYDFSVVVVIRLGTQFPPLQFPTLLNCVIGLESPGVSVLSLGFLPFLGIGPR